MHEGSTLVRISTGAVALLLAWNACCAAGNDVNTASLTGLGYSDGQVALRALDREIADAGQDRIKLRTITDSLLAQLKATGATFAARQAICQRLGTLLTAGPEEDIDRAALAPLRKMLTLDADVDLARLAFEPVPGAAVDALFVRQLSQSSDRVRLALLQSVAARRISSAVKAVSPLLAEADHATAAAAAYALGAIGTPEALDALRDAPTPNAPHVVEAMLAILPQLPREQAAGAARQLAGNSDIAPAFRTAALRTWIESDPGTAPARISELLSGGDWAAKEMAVALVASSDLPGLVPALVAKLASWDAPTQSAVIAALGRKADPVAEPAITAALDHAEADVRAAAIAALAALPGNANTVMSLATIIAGRDARDARAARDSLARVRGPGVDAAILESARQGPATLRPVFIEQLALRNMTEALPLLRDLRRDADAAIRSAAASALGVLAPASEQALLLAWGMEAADAAEQSQVLRALVSVIQRNPDQQGRTRPVIQAIEKAPAEIAVKVIPVLARLGDAASAECAMRLALRNDPAVATAATAALSRWADQTALTPLATVADKAPLESSRAAAHQAALRSLERKNQKWSADSTRAAVRLFNGTPNPATRLRLLQLLEAAREDEALALAEGLSGDATLSAAAEVTARSIRANRTGAEWKALFDGRNLNGWKSNDERPDVFTVEDEALKVSGGRAHLFYVGQDGKATFTNFELKAKVMTTPGANSGIYFHTEFIEEGWPPKGYECQVNTSHPDPRKTGSLYAVKDVMNDAPSKDNEWFDYYLRVEGRRIIIQVNGRTTVDWTQPEDWDPAKSLRNMPGRKLSSGTFALQGHDPKSTIYYKDIHVRALP